MPDTAMTLPPVREMVSAEEWEARVALAACYRLVAHYGWDDLVETHISMAVPGSGNRHFLINAYGMLFQQVTASSLVKIDGEGNAVLSSPYARFLRSCPHDPNGRSAPVLGNARHLTILNTLRDRL